MNSESVFPGSKVWIEGRRAGQPMRRWALVARRTRTQIVLADDFQSRFRRSTCEEIGCLHDRIVAVATDEEIADFEIENAARDAQEKVLVEEERQLNRLLAGNLFYLTRHGMHYEVQARGLSAGQIRAMFAAMKGVRKGARG